MLSVFRLALEKDNLEKESRDKETKILNLTRNLEEAQERIDQLERIRQQQARELEDLVSSQDDVGKNVSTAELLSVFKCWWRAKRSRCAWGVYYGHSPAECQTVALCWASWCVCKQFSSYMHISTLRQQNPHLRDFTMPSIRISLLPLCQVK